MNLFAQPPARLLAVLLGVTTLATTPVWARTVSSVCDNSGFLDAQKNYENGGRRGNVPVHICGQVVAVSEKAKHTRSGWHGYFYVNVGQGVSIRIVSNLDEISGANWPWVRDGDMADVVGRYYYDSPRRQGIDWTHHGTGRSWDVPGYVIVNGKRFD
ncbi:DUF3465 domain-containing protein [Acetobacter conturbans]|uniref:DUF3465 domain-containing protein n=1 Tax=Acetobacter conturbans TaxID=1737472 RepID=A0ABX0K096_9PROT|nr:DUF3465 domain-containing protein [Acetobacter conturbans]NHN88534.1 DUF3465 domain-containing protein [Acetobacter conturbans]